MVVTTRHVNTRCIVSFEVGERTGTVTGRMVEAPLTRGRGRGGGRGGVAAGRGGRGGRGRGTGRGTRGPQPKCHPWPSTLDVRAIHRRTHLGCYGKIGRAHV